jgi:hypothetical protein
MQQKKNTFRHQSRDFCGTLAGLNVKFEIQIRKEIRTMLPLNPHVLMSF